RRGKGRRPGAAAAAAVGVRPRGAHARGAESGQEVTPGGAVMSTIQRSFPDRPASRGDPECTCLAGGVEMILHTTTAAGPVGADEVAARALRLPPLSVVGSEEQTPEAPSLGRK